MDVLIGKKISNYIIKSFIAEGGMGSVYLCEHVSINKKAALKILHPQFSSNNEVTSRFEQEAKTISNLSHPNIIDILDFGEFEGRQFLLMEYVEGTPLDEYIEHKVGPINENDALLIMQQIISAIEMAHKNGIIHRDIKPSNVLIDANKNVKLIDFGIAKAIANSDLSKTRAGQMLGTLPYMSPEQIRGVSNINIETDIYSMGVLLHEMVTGKPPYESNLTEYDIIKEVTEKPLPRIRSIYPGAKAYFQCVIDKATEKKREDRYNSCGEFRKSLDEKCESINNIVNESSNSSVKSTTPISSTNAKKSKGWIIVIALLAMLMVLTFVFQNRITEIIRPKPIAEKNALKNKAPKDTTSNLTKVNSPKVVKPKKVNKRVKTPKKSTQYLPIPKTISFEDNFRIIADNRYDIEDRKKLREQFLNEFESDNSVVNIMIGGVKVETTIISLYLDKLLLIGTKTNVISKEISNGKYISIDLEEL
jgi:serine/threonine protein kinase